MALTTNLQAYYKMDGNSNDATGNGHNGADTSMTYSATNAVINQAGQFSGSGKILVPNAAGLTGTVAISLTGWFFYTGASLSGPVTILGKCDGVGAGGTYLRMNVTTSKLQATIDGDVHQINGSTTLSINTRYFGCVTYDGATLSLYLNGVKDATDQSFAHAVTPGTGSLGIGVLGDLGVQLWTGALDELGFWSRALTSSEVTQLYNSGNGFAYPFTTTVPGGLVLTGVGN